MSPTPAVVIPVTLNGEESRAILDSDATGNGVSERFLERHEGEYSNGKQIFLDGINGVRKVRLVNGLDIEMFGAADGLVSVVTKVSSVQRFNNPTMTIGPFTLENVIVMVPGEGEKATVGRESSAKPGSRLKKDKLDGILRYDVLKHFVVTIDFKRSLLHLAPPEE